MDWDEGVMCAAMEVGSAAVPARRYYVFRCPEGCWYGSSGTCHGAGWLSSAGRGAKHTAGIRVREAERSVIQHPRALLSFHIFDHSSSRKLQAPRSSSINLGERGALAVKRERTRKEQADY